MLPKNTCVLELEMSRADESHEFVPSQHFFGLTYSRDKYLPNNLTPKRNGYFRRVSQEVAKANLLSKLTTCSEFEIVLLGAF